jgi:hypothetical protein
MVLVFGLLVPPLPYSVGAGMPFPPQAAKLIRDRLNSGRLPCGVPTRMWAGFGTGQSCDGCDEPIVPAQVEYEFIVGDGRTIRFHLGCAGLWEAERRRRAYLTSF